MRKQKNIDLERIQDFIFVLRDNKVILDQDIAAMYGVETKRINEAVKNNAEKFPTGYIVSLSKEEWDQLKSKYSTSIRGGKVKLPKAFTEKGLYMLATVLKSTTATKTTIAIIEAFAKIRELSRNIRMLSEIQDEPSKNIIMKKSGGLIAEILDDPLRVSDTETTIEINFAVIKFKHLVKKTK